MKTFFKSAYKYILISVIIAVFIRLINFAGNDFSLDVLLDAKNFFISFLYALIIAMANGIGFSILYAKYSWEKHAKLLVIVGVIGSVIWSTLAFFIARYIHLVWIEGYTFDTFMQEENFLTYVFSMMIAFIATLAFHSFYFYKALQDVKLKEKTFESKSNSAKFDALKNQLDPHFLFNSLNVLSALIDEDTEKAQDFTIGLSKVYRYVLDQKNKDLVSLGGEIKFAETYLNLLKMRFEDSLEVDINPNSKTIEAKIIPLSLQLLLENAVKHNKVSEQNPLQIKIYTKGDYLIVENNLQPKIDSRKPERNGIGLENIQSRYELFTDRRCEIIKTDTTFSVKLPLLQLN